MGQNVDSSQHVVSMDISQSQGMAHGRGGGLQLKGYVNVIRLLPVDVTLFQTKNKYYEVINFCAKRMLYL